MKVQSGSLSELLCASLSFSDSSPPSLSVSPVPPEGALCYPIINPNHFDEAADNKSAYLFDEADEFKK